MSCFPLSCSVVRRSVGPGSRARAVIKSHLGERRYVCRVHFRVELPMTKDLPLQQNPALELPKPIAVAPTEPMDLGFVQLADDVAYVRSWIATPANTS